MTINGMLLVAHFLFATAVSDPAAAGPVERIEVLGLDQSLHARGQLGGVTVDRLGYIYVANFSDSVWRISPSGSVKLLTDGLYGSSGNTVDHKGDLYQANFHGDSIVKIDRFGGISTYVDEGLSGPVGLAFGKDKSLFVCNFKDNNILRVAPDRSVSVFADSDLLNGPNGITTDNSGSLFVVNFNNNQVVKIAPDGTSTVFAEIKGADGNAHIAYYNDAFYVTKIKSNQLFRINRSGQVKLLAGTGKNEISAGPALEASFTAPNGIGVDATTGAVYFNVVSGLWNSNQPTTIVVCKIDLLSIQRILAYHLDRDDLTAAEREFRTYRADAFHAEEDLGPSLSALGWQYMAKRKVPAALTVFELAKEAYPDRWRTHYNLAEFHKIVGQNDKAIEHYQEALELDPGNSGIVQKLSELNR